MRKKKIQFFLLFFLLYYWDMLNSVTFLHHLSLEVKRAQHKSCLLNMATSDFKKTATAKRQHLRL